MGEMTDDLLAEEESLAFDYPSAPTANVTTKRCYRHDWEVRPFPEHSGEQGCYHVVYRSACKRCGKVRNPVASRRSRNNKNRGLAIQRKRIEALGGTNLAGNNQNLDGIGLAFRYESKSGPSAFSERIWRWLTGIPVAGDQTQVLIVTDTPGPGRRARSYVVVTYEAWRDLHGEQR